MRLTARRNSAEKSCLFSEGGVATVLAVETRRQANLSEAQFANSSLGDIASESMIYFLRLKKRLQSGGLADRS